MSTFQTAFLAALLGAAPVASASPPAHDAAGPVVRMHGFAFVPHTIAIDAGTKLTFVNDDTEAHTASALDKSFDSAGLDGGESWSHTFAKPGTYRYVCELHPSMTGVIIVRPAAAKSTS